MRQAAAGRLIALCDDESEIETRPMQEIGEDLQVLGIDRAASIDRVRRLVTMRDSPAGVLLARIAEAEATERDIADLESARLEDLQARLVAPTPAQRAGERSETGIPRGASRTPLVSSQARRKRRGGAWFSPSVILGLVRFSDAAIVLIAVLAAYLTRFHTLHELGTLELYGGVLAAVLTINLFQLAGLYRFDQLTNLPGQAGRLLLAWTAVMVGLLALGFMTQAPLETTSRLWVSLSFVYGFFGLFTARLLLKQQIRSWQQAGRLTRNLAIVGVGEHGRRLIEHLVRRGDRAERIVGVFDDRRDGVPHSLAGFPVLGTVDDLIALARRQPIDQVIVALPWDAEERLQACISRLGALPVDLSFCPPLVGTDLARRPFTEVAGVAMLSVFEKPLTGWSYIAKTMEDRVLAACILLLIAPLLAVLALLIKLDSRGPVLFRQKRYGFDDEVIEVFKFRTLYAEHCDDRQVVQVSRNDPRVTRVGRFLRRTSLDELPQFINVLIGSMSIVGPRPHAVAHDDHYARVIDAYLARRRVKPGITGWAQVNGLRGEIATIERMEQRVRYDVYYIDNWSLLFDLRIILRTAFVAFRDSRAY